MPQRIDIDGLDETALARLFVNSASAAGARIMSHYGALETVGRKPDASPVTIADHEAEEIIKKMIEPELPSVPIWAEESAHGWTETGTVETPFILVDPVDGTKEFIRKGTDFTVNIALVASRLPVFGVVYCPALDTVYWGGTSAFTGRLPPGADFEDICETRTVVTVRQPEPGNLKAAASHRHRDAETDAFLSKLGITDCVSRGSSLKFCLVAKGDVDVYPRFGPTMEWDTAAGEAILRAAGGTVLTPEGEPFLYGKGTAGFLNGPFIAWGGRVL